MLYFAYGSNLLTSRLTARVGHVKLIGSYKLEGYHLCFNACNGNESYANVIKKENSFVEGYLYKLSREQIRMLSAYEALYDAKYLVDPEYGFIIFYEAIPFYTYNPNILPTLKYLEIILKGAKSKKLKTLTEYITNYINTYKKLVTI